MIRNRETGENLTTPLPTVQEALTTDSAYVAWLLVAIEEDRAESAPFFKVPVADILGTLACGGDVARQPQAHAGEADRRMEIRARRRRRSSHKRDGRRQVDDYR